MGVELARAVILGRQLPCILVEDTRCHPFASLAPLSHVLYLWCSSRDLLGLFFGLAIHPADPSAVTPIQRAERGRKAARDGRLRELCERGGAGAATGHGWR